MVIIIFVIIIVLYIISIYPRYLWYFPSLPFYPNNEYESNIVYLKTKERTSDDESFFYLTDASVSEAFLPYTTLSKQELESLILQPKITIVLLFFKYIINRARPWQVDKRILKLKSNTDGTPAYPAGHAFQAYYLSVVLTRHNPEHEYLYNHIAQTCDEVRIKAGIHYPSDGTFAKYLVDMLVYMKIY